MVQMRSQFSSFLLLLVATRLIKLISGVDAKKISTSIYSHHHNPQNHLILKGGSTKEKRKLTSFDLAFAGSLATMVGDAALHPVDCIKTLQQSTEGTGMNMFDAGRKIWKDFGIGGFYSGLGTYVLSDGGAGAIKFATYEAVKQWVSDKVPEDYMGAAIFGCAAVAFVASSVVLVPGELIKQRLQMGQYDTIGSAVKSIWEIDGITGFFRGYSGVCLRDIPYTMLELGLYENFKNLYLKLKNRRSVDGKESQITQFDEIVAAAVTGGITGYVTNPLDTIKTKLMVDAGLYSGFFDCARKTVAQNGVGSLFQGGTARVAWLMPFTAIYLPLYDLLKRTLEQRTVTTPKIVGGKGLKVKGGAQQVSHYPLKQVNNDNDLQMQISKSYLKKHSREKRVCFISF